MTFQSVPETAEAVIQGTAGGSNIANVLNFRQSGGYNITSLQALATLVDTTVGAYYLPYVSAGANYDQTLVRGLENINDLEAVENASAGPGTAGGTGLPNNVSNVITLRSAFTGRSARGRFYAWPTGLTFTASPTDFTTGYVTALEAFLIALAGAAAAISWDFVVVSRRTLGAVRPLGVTFQILTIQGRNTKIDSQRGRLFPGH